MKCDHKSIEQKWQQRWADAHAFEAKEKGDKFYALIEFPYPSGEGLHVGHLRSYTAMDIIARKRRMEGRNVLFPIGWDAFGLPAENYAIKTGRNPRDTTEENCTNFRRQLKTMGFSFDWSREVNTTDPAYYKWTQWIFLQLLKHGLAYKAKVPINWCLACKIGLANEEAVGGVCERCGGSVEKRDREQWMLKITAYAEKLLAGLETVDYIEAAKVQQTNWIGKSEGALLKFQIPSTKFQINSKSQAPNSKFEIEVFTTRPDTLFGATYLVLAPEHPLIVNNELRITNYGEVQAYIQAARRKTDIERTSEEKEKTGVELKGIRAINPANGEEIPVWIADYVLAHYGTGAIMAVPAHDERDFAFAKKYELVIREVVRPDNYQLSTINYQLESTYTGDGILINSGRFTGMPSEDAKRAITEAVGGKMTVTYKLRDWVFSRQRYWGEPIPVVFCAGCAGSPTPTNSPSPGEGEKNNFPTPMAIGVGRGGVGMTVTLNGIEHAIIPIPEDQLPVLLPDVEKYQPTDSGDSPLAAITDWVNTKCPRCGGSAKRETDVMPNWAGSSWYFLRYCDPHNDQQLADLAKLKHWMPVDWYNGGMEHITLHVLYSRFWNLFLHDIGVVPVAEPYKKRTSHGLILASDGEKMSKSRGNVVNPDEIVEKFGADAVRLYEMFIGPFDQSVPWSTDGLVGVRRFLEKVCSMGERVNSEAVGDDGNSQLGTRNSELTRLLHRTIKKVTEDIEAMRFNTAVSALMILTNELGKQKMVPGTIFETLLMLLSPFAPHLCEELWEDLQCRGGATSPPERSIAGDHVGSPLQSILNSSWPSYDPALARETEIDLVIQVNGKVRATIRVSADITEADARSRALAEPNVAKYIEEKEVKKIIFIPGKLMNIVV